jgi:hypothetical protein
VYCGHLKMVDDRCLTCDESHEVVR